MKYRVKITTETVRTYYVEADSFDEAKTLSQDGREPDSEYDTGEVISVERDQE